jgi:hypothetical protein
MLKPNRLLLLGLAFALRASVAQAQVCLGLPSFSRTTLHLNASGEFPDSATAYAAAIGLGKDASLFGNVGAGQVSYEGYDPKATLGFVELGWQVPVSRAQICPVAGGYYASGPNDDSFGLEIKTRGGSAGLALGVPLDLGGFSLIPNVAVRYEYSSTEYVEDGYPPDTVTAHSGLVDLGLAVLLGGRLSVQPLYHIPFNSDDTEKTIGVFLAIALF